MFSNPTARAGFERPREFSRPYRRRSAVARLITVTALAVSLVVSVGAVSIGIARDQSLTAVAASCAKVARASIATITFGAVGGLTAIIPDVRPGEVFGLQSAN